MEEVKTLPMRMPPCETYQGMAFIMGVLLSHENIKNYFHNTYISLRCANSDKMWDLTLELNHILWDPLGEDGVFEVNRYNANALSEDSFVGFLKERIRQGNYILLFQIDEFYLSYSQDYNNRHFIHDVYIYGYDNDCFCVMAYRDDRLQLFKVKQTEIRDAFYSCCKECEGEVAFCTCRPWHLANIEIDYKKMKESIIDYYMGAISDNHLYGILTYQAIIRALKKMKEDECPETIDVRVFRMLWEHKILMRSHLETLGNKMSVNDAIEAASEVEKIGEKVFRLSMKYRMTKADKTLVKMIENIENMEKKERQYLSRLVESFKCCIS